MTSSTSPLVPPDLTGQALGKWFAANPYFLRRLVLAKRLNPKHPRYLYKYRSISPDDTQSVKQLSDILLDSKLWLSSPHDFNDPFDMSARVTFDGDAQRKRGRFKSLIARTSPELDWKGKRSLLEQCMTKPDDEWLTTITKTFHDNVKNVGVISFAGDAKNILMWSHYANNHAGICLQFEIARDPEAFLGAVPADYTAEYPTLNWVSNVEEQLTSIILRKYEAWCYEKERRIVLPGEAHTYLPFSPVALTAIVVGCKASPAVLDLLKSILSERAKKMANTPKVYVAKKHPTRYAHTIHSHVIDL